MNRKLLSMPVRMRGLISRLFAGHETIRGRWLWLMLVSFVTVTALSRAQGNDAALSETYVDWTNHPAIEYRTRPTNDPVAKLNRRLQTGEVTLTRDGPSRYLRSVLNALDVPIDSQMMVFARDSVQSARITRDNPRALYFNDTVAVGWVRGGFIELAAQDPRQGVIFYTLELPRFGVSLDTLGFGSPMFNRRNECLTCHFSYSSVGVPGMLNRSAGKFTVTQQVPFEERWGGWFVTGQHGSARHLGNVELTHVFDAPLPSGMSNWPSLEGKVDTTGYLAPQSDIVALLVFEHQMRMMNLLTRIGWEAQVAEYRQRTPPKAQPGADGDDSSVQPMPIDQAAREVVDHMLFVNEAPLPSPVRGATSFAARFATAGPRDSKGRSLRDLDLQRRVFRYPCSYLIYSAQFDQLPPIARNAIYRRLWEVLSGAERGKPYSVLSAADRAAVVDILRDTKRDLPDFFRSPGP